MDMQSIALKASLEQMNLADQNEEHELQKALWKLEQNASA